MENREATKKQSMAQMPDEEFFEKFLAHQPWPQETEEDRFLDELLQREMDEEVKREEALIRMHPEIASAEPPDDLFDRIMEKAEKMEAVEKIEKEIQETEKKEKIVAFRPEEYLSEEDRKALEIGRAHMQGRKKRRLFYYLAANAAVMVCVFFVGVSTEANRTKIMNAFNTLIGNEAIVRVDNETDREEHKKEEDAAAAKIEEQLGIKPVRFLYEPEGMEFDSYQVDKKAEVGTMFYQYWDTVFTIVMRKKEVGTSQANMKDGEIEETFEISTDIGNIIALKIQGEHMEKCITEFIYNNTAYYIAGEISKEEFEKLISYMFF